MSNLGSDKLRIFLSFFYIPEHKNLVYKKQKKEDITGLIISLCFKLVTSDDDLKLASLSTFKDSQNSRRLWY